MPISRAEHERQTRQNRAAILSLYGMDAKLDEVLERLSRLG